jgi:NCS1 family nucleobase:cation symporter-1
LTEEKLDTMKWVLSRPIRPNERAFSSFDSFMIWFATGVIITAPAAGGLAIGAPVLWVTIPLMTVVAAIAFVPHYFSGKITQKYGLTNFIASRRAFGILGTNFGGIYNLLQCLGYLSVQTVMAGMTAVLVLDKFGFSIPFWIVIAIMFVATIFFVIFGPLGLKWAQTGGSIALIIFGITITYVLLTGGFDWNTILFTPNPNPTSTYPMVLELFVAYNLTWLPLIGDYSRYAKTSRAGAWMPIVGLCAAQFWFYVLGALSMGVLGTWDPSGFVAKYGLGQGMASMLFMVIGAITTNAVLLYSAITSLLPIYPKKLELGLNRWIILGVFVAITFGLCFTPILDLFGAMLVALSGVTISSFFGISVADWLYHKFTLDMEELYNLKGSYRYLVGFNLRAIIPMIISIAIQEYIYFYHYEWITWAGIVLPGMILSALLYLVLLRVFPPAYMKK